MIQGYDNGTGLAMWWQETITWEDKDRTLSMKYKKTPVDGSTNPEITASRAPSAKSCWWQWTTRQ